MKKNLFLLLLIPILWFSCSKGDVSLSEPQHSGLQPDIKRPPPQPIIKVYVGLLTQVGENAPSEVVLENTLGFDLQWSYVSPGIYVAQIQEPTFFENKTAIKMGTFDGYGAVPTYVAGREGSDYAIFIRTYDNESSFVNNSLKNTLLEIKVYP